MAEDSKLQHTLTILEPLLKTLPASIILSPSSPDYILHSEPFAIQKQRNPPIVFVPNNVEYLSKIIRFLYTTKLDFAIRGRGFKSPSAEHVIVSMMQFDGFEYDREKKLITVGVGSTWKDVVSKMEEVDPEYSPVVARTPAIGVGGTILTGGLSWMSTEYGCCSDPINFLDAEIVKWDGAVTMASQEPDLLWGLRGGGGGLGVMTKVILRAHYYPTKIWSGMVLIPRQHLRDLVVDISKFLDSNPHPKINFFMYLVKTRLLPTILDKKEQVNEDIVALHVYDALGEKHGREMFQWALEKEGAIDRTTVTNMKGIVNMQHAADAMRGTMKTLYAPMGVSHLSAEEIQRAFDWYDGLAAIDENTQQLSVIAFEFQVNRSPFGGLAEVAWARPIDMQHLLLIIMNAPKDSSAEHERIIQDLLLEAPAKILGEKAKDARVNPAGLEGYHDPKATYGQHFDKLAELRKKYDPNRRFKGLVNPDN